jgi:enoyl-CoA hydratase/carnithine racemase
MNRAAQVHIDIETRDGGDVAFITLDNQKRMNSFSAAMMKGLLAAFESLKSDKALRCVVLTGAGDRAFVAGADIHELADIAYPAEARAFIGKLHDCCEAVRAFPVPVIARINGVTLGAGVELAISCDLTVASETATFGMPEVRIGVPSVVEAALLPSLIGWGRTREMLLLGQTYDAAEALAMGLVGAVAPADGLDAAVEKRIAAIFAGRPEAIKLQKSLMRRWENLTTKEAILAGAEAFAEAYLTDEPWQALDAWRSKRARQKVRG